MDDKAALLKRWLQFLEYHLDDEWWAIKPATADSPDVWTDVGVTMRDLQQETRKLLGGITPDSSKVPEN
jgi:hypothetical protein